MSGITINGEVKYVSDMDDFIELVYECMGKDAAKYLREQIDELQTELDYFYSN